MKALFLLMSFMTRLPVPQVEYDQKLFVKAYKLFPMIGILFGLILYFFNFLLSKIFYSSLMITIFLILIEVILTGALHLDGLADTFDAIFSYRTKEKMLEIMKDPHIGTNGVLALIFLIAIKLFSINYLLDFQMEYILLIYPVIGRISSVASCSFLKYARESGMSNFINEVNYKDLLISLAYSMLYFFMIFRDLNYISLLLSFVLPLLIVFWTYIFSKKISKKLGGISGDTLGAVVELNQVLFLCLFIMFLRIEVTI